MRYSIWFSHGQLLCFITFLTSYKMSWGGQLYQVYSLAGETLSFQQDFPGLDPNPCITRQAGAEWDSWDACSSIVERRLHNRAVWNWLGSKDKMFFFVIKRSIQNLFHTGLILRSPNLTIKELPVFGVLNKRSFLAAASGVTEFMINIWIWSHCCAA
jgi:hypothetical protein